MTSTMADEGFSEVKAKHTREAARPKRPNRCQRVLEEGQEAPPHKTRGLGSAVISPFLQ